VTGVQTCALPIYASLYYIDWKDIQLDATNGIGAFLTNASSAKSEGIELAAELNPLEGLTISAWAAYNNAVLTSDFPLSAQAAGAFGLSGDRLPFSSRFSGTFSVDDEFPLVNATRGFLGGSVSYVGDRESGFTASPSVPRIDLPSYAKIDLHAGIHYGFWKARVFLNNVADKRGVVGFSGPPFFVNYVQPRTVGLSVSRDF
jgi:outer membrane receptor protein involved in Fe transport